MATMDASKVTIGAARVTGAIYIAPKNTTLPTDATTTLANTFKLLGFTSDAGVQIAENRESESVTAWEGRTKILELVTSYTESVSFMPIQCNEEVAKTIEHFARTIKGNTEHSQIVGTFYGYSFVGSLFGRRGKWTFRHNLPSKSHE